MVRHFLRRGKPSRTMVVTALFASLFGVLNLIALGRLVVWLFPVAFGLYLASGALFWWAVSVTRGKLAACGQGCISPEVIARGPYRYIRHPFYAAYNLTWIAGFVATGWWPLAVSAILMASLYEGFAREEESGFSRSALADDYRNYKLRTGRYLPLPRSRNGQ